MNNKNILQVSNLTKLFFPDLSLKDLLCLRLKPKPPCKALDNISFTLEKQKILCLLGPNGAGKTTLLKTIATVLIPDQGTVAFPGFPGSSNELQIRANIGMLSTDERSFYCRISLRRNLEFFSVMYGVDKKTASARIKSLSKMFNLTDLDKRFDICSAGTKRKCALIKALIHDPKLILLDEPTKSLDYNSSCQFWDHIQFLKKESGKTFIIATHNIDEAQRLYDEFAVIKNGRLLSTGKRSDNPEIKKIFLKDSADEQ